MKRYASTIALFVLTLALGVWLWLDKGRVSDSERRGRENRVFFAWRQDDVTRVELAHEGETLVLERATLKGPWRMTSPVAERADEAAVDRLLGLFEAATIERKLHESEGLGFDAPRASGTVTMGSLTFHFVLGGPSPRPSGSSYFRVDDRAPFVISKELTALLLAHSDTYRDRTVVPYLAQELARLDVRGPKVDATFVRKDERTMLVEGTALRASRAALDKVWAALAEMRAEAFLKDRDAEELTRRPRLTLRLVPKEAGKPTSELVVGAACPGHPDDVVVLRTQPTRVLACAPKGAIDALEGLDRESLVDRRVLSFRQDEVEELRLELLGGADAGASVRVLELARRGTGFHQREPADRELSPPEAEAASELIARIEGTTASAFADASAPFVAVARARFRSGEFEEAVEVGRADAESVTLRRVHDDARLIVSRASARRLLPRVTSTRSRALLDDSRRVTRLVLRCGPEQVLVDSGAGLRLVEPTGYETDGSVTQLVDGLTRGKALLWVADRDDGTFGLETGACRAELTFADGSAPTTVRFGTEGEGGLYGLIEGHPEVFVAPLALGALARRLYVSHAALRVLPERIESVRVEVGGRERPRSSLERLRAAAGGLFAERVVALGKPDVGRADVVLTFTLAEGGTKKRVLCGAEERSSAGRMRKCVSPDVQAVFEVRASAMDAFVRDDSVEAVDAGRD